MEWLTNNMIFYGGLIISSVALLLAFIFLLVFSIKKVNLNAQLDSEYGKQIKRTSKAEMIDSQ